LCELICGVLENFDFLNLRFSLFIIMKIIELSYNAYIPITFTYIRYREIIALSISKNNKNDINYTKESQSINSVLSPFIYSQLRSDIKNP